MTDTTDTTSAHDAGTGPHDAGTGAGMAEMRAVHSSSSSTGNAPVSYKASSRAPAPVYSRTHDDATHASPNPQEEMMEAEEAVEKASAFDKFADSLAGLVTPPEIWSKGSRPLKDEWDYAKNGGWTTDVGFIRFFGQAYSALVVFPIFTVAELVKWTVARPARLAALVVLFTLLAQFPPLNWVI